MITRRKLLQGLAAAPVVAALPVPASRAVSVSPALGMPYLPPISESDAVDAFRYMLTAIDALHKNQRLIVRSRGV